LPQVRRIATNTTATTINNMVAIKAETDFLRYIILHPILSIIYIGQMFINIFKRKISLKIKKEKERVTLSLLFLSK
jgi:hypothetical protein